MTEIDNDDYVQNQSICVVESELGKAEAIVKRSDMDGGGMLAELSCYCCCSIHFGSNMGRRWR